MTWVGRDDLRQQQVRLALGLLEAFAIGGARGKDGERFHELPEGVGVVLGDELAARGSGTEVSGQRKEHLISASKG